MRDRKELVVVQRFTKATRPPSHKDAIADASGAGYVAAEPMALLLRDARCLAKNWHPNVCRVRHVDLVGSELTVATELVDGVTLADLIELARAKRTGDNKEPVLPYPVLARVIVDVLGGLHGLHGLRDGMNAPLEVFHGELSPANIVLGKDGVARVAHVFRPKPVKIDARSEGLGYASPETLAGEAQQDARADLYSVGAILWEGLAGRRLYADDDPAKVAQRQREEDLAKPDVPPTSPFARLVDVAFRALSFDPALRYRTASEMATELRRITGTRLAPGSAVAQTVMELAGDRIRARRMELDPSSSGARRAHAARTARAPEVDTVPKAPPRMLEAAASAATDPPPPTTRASDSERNLSGAAKPKPPAPKPPPPRAPAAIPKPAPPIDAGDDDLPGPRASNPNIPDGPLPAPAIAALARAATRDAPNDDALAMAAAKEVSVGEASLVEPSSAPPPSERLTVASVDVIPVAMPDLPPPPPPEESAPRIDAPLARTSTPGDPIAVLSLGPAAPEPPPRRRRFVPLVAAIAGLALLLLVVAGIASIGGSKEETKSTASAGSSTPTSQATPAPPPTVTAAVTTTASAPSPEPAPTAAAAPGEPDEPAAPASAAVPETTPAPRFTGAPPPAAAPKKPKKSAYEPLGI
jgi:serine/threonine-protein kinase